jgi:hypothetical protein
VNIAKDLTLAKNDERGAMMKAKFLVMMVGILGLLLTACGTTKPAHQGLTEESAEALSTFALDSSERLAAMMPAKGGLAMSLASGTSLPKQLSHLLPQRGLTSLSSEGLDCITIDGDVTDADLDEIPVAASFTFDCSFSEEGVDTIVTGSAHFQDANDADALSGYAIEFVDFTITETKDGQTNVLELDQTFILAVADDKSLYIIENDLVLTATTPKEKIIYSELATLGYAPDDIADPFATGTFALNGVTTWQSGEDVYQLSEVSPALHYSATCESGFDGGTLYIEDNFENRLELIYNACNNVTVIYNGSPLEK